MNKKQPRFVKGKLVMLSRKNRKSGKIRYFHPGFHKSVYGRNKGIKYLEPAGLLDRGTPILLIEDPKKVSLKDVHWTSRPGLNNNKNAWKIEFLLHEKAYKMYLSNNQYNHELVLAVPRRIHKNYEEENSSKVNS